MLLKLDRKSKALFWMWSNFLHIFESCNEFLFPVALILFHYYFSSSRYLRSISQCELKYKWLKPLRCLWQEYIGVWRGLLLKKMFLKFPDIWAVIPYCRKYRPSSSTMLALRVISNSMPKATLLVSGKLMRKALLATFNRKFLGVLLRNLCFCVQTAWTRSFLYSALVPVDGSLRWHRV